MTNDREESEEAYRIVNAIVRRAKLPRIIIVHEGHYTRQGYDRTSLVQALPLIITDIEQRGHHFVTAVCVTAGR